MEFQEIQVAESALKFDMNAEIGENWFVSLPYFPLYLYLWKNNKQQHMIDLHSIKYISVAKGKLLNIWKTQICKQIKDQIKLHYAEIENT